MATFWLIQICIVKKLNIMCFFYNFYCSVLVCFVTFRLYNAGVISKDISSQLYTYPHSFIVSHLPPATAFICDEPTAK